MACSVFAMVLLSGCTQEKKEEKVVQQPKVVVQEEAKLIKDETIEKVASDLKDKTSDVIDTAAAMAKELSKDSKVMADDLTVESKKVITKIAKESKAVTKSAVETLNEVKKNFDVKMDEVIETNDSTLTSDETSKAKGLFLKCAGCHGQKAERSALNKSQIIKGWQSQQIIDALKGYKDGTYGSVMKGLMQGQVANLSDYEIELLAQYITTLK